MKIVQIDTYDITGGAARAAYRLHLGLLQIGQDCRTLVRYKASTDDSIFCVIPENPPEKVEEEFFLSVAIQQHYIDSHRTDISNTLFSLPYPGYDLSMLPMVQAADIINLHWVAQYQSPLTLHKLFALGKPVVWTLHDQWAFTGGCHYAAGCEEYRHGCAPCPQLADDPFGLPAAVLKDKLRFFKDANLTIVTPSRWMAECARQSRLFKDLRVEVIPNSLETDVFVPQPKSEAKERMGIGAETITLLFGGEDSNERRKGFRELKAAIKYCLKDARFQNLVKSDKIRMICFGRLSGELEALGIPVVQLGYLDSDEKISAAYSSADIFILPSLEDNLPNTMLEAMSCGTPVVAFDVGGMPDVVINQVTGQLVPMGDVKEMGKAILSLMLNTEQREWMGKECHKKIEEQYRLNIQAQRYLELYQELIDPYASTAEATSEDHTSSLWQIPVPSKERPLSVTLELSVGSYFKDIYDQVLFKSLKEFVFYVQERWQMSEADRAARLNVIGEQGEKIADLESKIDFWLNDSKRLQKENSETKAERDGLRFELKSLREQLEGVEADRAARLKVIEQLGEKLEASESDRAARLKVIEDQGEKIAELETEVDQWLGESKRLQKEHGKIEAERNELRQRAIEADQNEARYRRMEAEFRELKLQAQRLRKEMGNFETERAAGLEMINTLTAQLKEGEQALQKIRGSRVVNFLGKLGFENFRDINVSAIHRPRRMLGSKVKGKPLVFFKRGIDSFNNSQLNKAQLDSIRAFNHNMIDQLNDVFPLTGCLLLDIGASPHGYAMEMALEQGVTLYIGIGLDIAMHEYVMGETDNVGILLNMDATALKFPDAIFDAVFSISAFEHIVDVSSALAEVYRVLKPGGRALISFEPVWSCSYGHHLHHFPSCSGLIPPWAHLTWSPEKMRERLFDKWPKDAPLSLEQAIEWIYFGNSINRLNIREFQEMFDNCPLKVAWVVDLPEEKDGFDPETIERISRATGLHLDELTTKGLSVLLIKE